MGIGEAADGVAPGKSPEADPAWPEWRSLFHGAVRESLAAAHSVAKIGIQDTHAWEQTQRYVVEETEGPHHFDLTPEVTQLVLAISSRAVIGTTIAQLSEQEIERLIPPDSECRDDAVEYLVSGGLFRVS